MLRHSGLGLSGTGILCRQRIGVPGILTADRQPLASSKIAQIAAHYARTALQIIFRFALEVGMISLTGTTNAGHMHADHDVFDFSLNPAEIEQIEGLDAW